MSCQSSAVLLVVGQITSLFLSQLLTHAADALKSGHPEEKIFVVQETSLDPHTQVEDEQTDYGPMSKRNNAKDSNHLNEQPTAAQEHGFARASLVHQCDLGIRGIFVTILRVILPFTFLLGMSLSQPAISLSWSGFLVPLPPLAHCALFAAILATTYLFGITWHIIKIEVRGRAVRDANADDAYSAGCGFATLSQLHQSATLKTAINIIWAVAGALIWCENEFQFGIGGHLLGAQHFSGDNPFELFSGSANTLWVNSGLNLLGLSFCGLLLHQASHILKKFNPIETFCLRIIETYLRAAQSRKDPLVAKRQAREILANIRRGLLDIYRSVS